MIRSLVACLVLVGCGSAGKDGVPGVNGVNGKDGVTGATGKDGENGTHGKDGSDNRIVRSVYCSAKVLSGVWEGRYYNHSVKTLSSGDKFVTVSVMLGQYTQTHSEFLSKDAAGNTSESVVIDLDDTLFATVSKGIDSQLSIEFYKSPKTTSTASCTTVTY